MVPSTSSFLVSALTKGAAARRPRRRPLTPAHREILAAESVLPRIAMVSTHDCIARQFVAAVEQRMAATVALDDTDWDGRWNDGD